MHTRSIRLGVNIDHVATIRNARRGKHPDPTEVAILAQKSGAEVITVHLREDRRHILDADLVSIKEKISIPINFEMAPTKEMLDIALKVKPHSICIVPERREEVTTEGGIDVIKHNLVLKEIIDAVKAYGIRPFLFIDPSHDQILESKRIGADGIEIHTGAFCNLEGDKQDKEFERIKECSKFAKDNGLLCHAGHGLNYETAKKIASIKEIDELNIGHFIISEAIIDGISLVIQKMKKCISSV